MSPPRVSPQPAYIHPCAPERARSQQGSAHHPPVHLRGRHLFLQQARQPEQAALHLDPATAITRRKRSRPEANLFRPQSRIRYFKNDAAYIFVSEEIVARELEVVLRSFHVAEERVAPPASKEADIACLCNRRLTPYWNRCTLNDHPSAIASPGGLRAITAVENCGLCVALEC